jgi:hypothetical protein
MKRTAFALIAFAVIGIGGGAMLPKPAIAEPGGMCTLTTATPSARYEPLLPQCTNGRALIVSFPSSQPISGTVSVSNFPATQPVSGSVSVSNFPVTQSVSGSVSVVGNVPVLTGGTSTATIGAATAGPTVIKASAGTITRALITTAGTTGTETFYDNASACSGTIIGIVPGTTAVTTAVSGTSMPFEFAAANGITACGGTGSAAVTVGFF